MNILLELNNKIDELKKSGMEDSQIKIEGLAFLKNTLRSASFDDRKDFWRYIDRDKKLNEILK